MRVAVANSDFSVALLDKNRQGMKPYQVANGEDLKILTECVSGVVKSEDGFGIRAVRMYLVEIEGQSVLVDESLLEVSK
jgi:hypothetical protein